MYYNHRHFKVLISPKQKVNKSHIPIETYQTVLYQKFIFICIISVIEQIKKTKHSLKKY